MYFSRSIAHCNCCRGLLVIAAIAIGFAIRPAPSAAAAPEPPAPTTAPTPAEVKRWMREIAGDDYPAKLDAVQALGTVTDKDDVERAVQVLLRMLDDESWNVRLRTVQSLGR